MKTQHIGLAALVTASLLLGTVSAFAQGGTGAFYTVIASNDVRQLTAGATNYFRGILGVGTNLPAEALHVVGNARVDGVLRLQGTNTSVGIEAVGIPGGPGATATWVGPYAAYAVTGDYWTAVGGYAGQQATGSYWTALGMTAGYKAAGNSWTAQGRSAGSGATGNYWVAEGFQAGMQASGDYWGAMGNSAGYQSIGARWVALGYQAGRQIVGSDWVAIGYWGPGYSVITSSYFTAIGVNAGRKSSGTNNVFVGYNAYLGSATVVCTNVSMIGANTYSVWSAATNALKAKDNICILGNAQKVYVGGGIAYTPAMGDIDMGVYTNGL